MHIKQITISNFRSFKQQPEIQPFSAGTNSVVGRNGSGKSNLFDAVQFVLLSPRFYNLRMEERQALLHEGSGSAAMNAFVEIVFDNSDHRFSLENSDEVVIRRTVGNKKDEFFLQRKRTTKSEIASLLEGAGFSKSNQTYFMVQQGKIQDLCIMSDKNRLDLLKSVAGTILYDEKKLESMNKMDENSSSIEKIQQILNDIENRLNELHDEKEELVTYQKYDRYRRAIEYSWYEKELNKARQLLDQIHHARQEHNTNVLGKLHEDMKANHTAIQNVEALLKTKSNALKRNKAILKQTANDASTAMQEQTKLQLQTEEIEENIAALEKQKQQNLQELKKVQKNIDKATNELNNQVIPKLEGEQTALQQLTEQKNDIQYKLSGLTAKRARIKQQFNSKEERDQHLQHQINENNSILQDKQSLLNQSQDKLANLRRKCEQDKTSMEEMESEIREKQDKTLKEFNANLDEKKHERLTIIEERKELYRKQGEITDLIRDAREMFHKSISDLRKTMPKNTSLGIEALKSIVEKENLIMGEQYFGMVIDNFTLKNDKYSTAVEVALQNSLFHVIVDTDVTAARLMKRLEDGRLGRITFLPLNRLHQSDDDDPYYQNNNSQPSGNASTAASAANSIGGASSFKRNQENNDIQNMLEVCIDYDKTKVDAAMKHVFYKKLLGRTTEIASEYSVRFNVDVITLDGDLCTRKGALTGGYQDTGKSRINAYQTRITAQNNLSELEGQYQELKTEIVKIDKSHAQNKHELDRLTNKSKEATRIIKDKTKDLNRLKKQHTNNGKQIQKIESNTIPPLEGEIATLKKDIERLQSEMGTELVMALSTEEQAQLEELQQSFTDVTNQEDAQNDKVNAIEFEKQKLENLLNNNLLKRKQELESGQNYEDDDDFDGGTQKSSNSHNTEERYREELEIKKRELEIAVKFREESDAKLAEVQNVDAGLRSDIHKAKNELESLKSQDIKTAKQLEEAEEKADKMLTKRSLCITKRETYTRKIQDLGAIPPPSELEQFASLSMNELAKSLDKVNNKLKKYSHVNKKAYDQYVNFSEQRDALLKRKEELDLGGQKIQELIDNLDKQKDEAINRTFRGVSSHFKDVFKELVPLGEGELVMKTALAEGDEEETDEEGGEEGSPKKQKKSKFDPNNPDVSLYRGVSVKVRFSRVGENYMMSQLSGGQKALVALALIFAIQRCDPAPFYLFDELDQALDSTYRAAVAGLLQRQANNPDNPTQFIVSTFRPELVRVANRCFGISHQNKVSSFHPLSKNDALHFISNLMNEEEAVGEVSTSTSRTSRARASSSRKRKAIEAAEEEEDQKTDGEMSGGSGN